MTARFKDHILGPDTHTNRPAANTVPEAALYECTTHGLVYKSVAGAWVTWGALIPPGGSAGQVLAKNSNTNQDVVWATPSGGSSGSYPPGSADVPPGTPNAKDDEFDGSSTATWTNTPTAPNTAVVNTDRASHLHLKSSGTGAKLVGRYQGVPTFPFTLTAKLSGTSGSKNFHRAGGLVLYPSGPTTTSNPVYFGAVSNTGIEIVRILYSGEAGFTSQSTFVGSAKNGAPLKPVYLRAVFTNATTVSFYFSNDGFSWILAESYTVPFSVANVGLALAEEAVGGGVDAYFDFFRIS